MILDDTFSQFVPNKTYNGTPPEMNLRKKTPEMDELEPVLQSLKISTHNFEKHKSWRYFSKPQRVSIFTKDVTFRVSHQLHSRTHFHNLYPTKPIVVPPPEMDLQEKSPEMNELEPGLKSLKI